ncbi:multiple sugar transport system permease protein [Deinococcus metalli]|uniref:Multiple sugar transport system permease protein n=1 Tax=Deinococcus metalli TaxID=1141878 RepID=A0A7W8KCL1_9DEIO|nr:sugar ABC transporter permease [Deinococcus metalli]MBB5375699.1 multiple sugar transport system permease protein [Deinococcus metalli]GHF37689.1 sugar ABC transporter permease [Deinococcus metalli]
MTVQSDAIPAPAVTAGQRNTRRGSQEAMIGYLFILPAIIGFVLFYLYPAIRGFTISFTDWNLLSAPKNVGLDNYATAIHDPKFWSALAITVKYVLWNIPLQTILAILLAVAMDRLVKSMFIKGLLIVPYLLSSVLVALIFLWLLDPLLGIVNIWLSHTPIGKQAFFASETQAIPTIAMVNIWKYTGFNALLFYAGLQSIPRTVYEAAAIDGAQEWSTFWKITMPLLRPVTVFVLVTSVIGSFQIFDTIAVATQGGPADATKVLVFYIYQNAFSFFKMGYATAMSMLLFALLVVFTLVQMRLLRANESDLD